MKSRIPQNDEVFSYYTPHCELAPYIAYYSITRPHAVLSSISPIFLPELGGSIIVSRYENAIDLSVWGPFNRLTNTEDSPSGALVQYFIEFHPSGLSRLIYPNCSALLNRKISLDEIDRGISHALTPIFEAVNCEPCELVNALDRCFLGLLENRRDTFESGRPVLKALQAFEEGGTLKALSRDTHYSTRHINRYINALVGVPGKNYMLVKRFIRTAHLLKKSTCTLEFAASLLGYYDTAHLVHDFTRIAGLSPDTYRNNMSAFYNDFSKTL